MYVYMTQICVYSLYIYVYTHISATMTHINMNIRRSMCICIYIYIYTTSKGHWGGGQDFQRGTCASQRLLVRLGKTGKKPFYEGLRNHKGQNPNQKPSSRRGTMSLPRLARKEKSGLTPQLQLGISREIMEPINRGYTGPLGITFPYSLLSTRNQ